MTRNLRKYMVQILAVLGLIAVGLAASWIILQEQRLRVPLLEERPFELKAELETGQAVTAGQGQTLRVAGVQIGLVEDVELIDGRAVVTFGVDRKYLPIYRDATILMRPQTGLKDMFFSLDPGTSDAGSFAEGGTVELANTAPDVNVDEILEALDTDTRSYLRLALVGLGKGLEERGDDLGGAIGALGPINRDLKRLNGAQQRRDEELARLVHNTNVLTAAVADRDGDLSTLVGASNEAVGALADQAPDLERLAARLPGTLETARETFDRAQPFVERLGPTLGALRPSARRLDEVADATERLAVRGTPALHEQIRPLLRAARPATGDLTTATERLADATPRLSTATQKLNTLLNMAAYNPRGAEPPGTEGRDEGYLYWAGWFSHIGPSIWSGQDAHGPYRRLYLTAGCAELLSILETSPFGPVLGGITTGLGPLFEPGAECG